jgi:hypothetical protein
VQSERKGNNPQKKKTQQNQAKEKYQLGFQFCFVTCFLLSKKKKKKISPLSTFFFYLPTFARALLTHLGQIVTTFSSLSLSLSLSIYMYKYIYFYIFIYIPIYIPNYTYLFLFSSHVG